MKIAFMGSPDFAVPSLEALVENRFEVCLVVTQPDRRAGRGRKMLPTAVKTAAQAHGLPVMDYGKGDGKAISKAIINEKPDAVVVVAFGHILREPLLSNPPLGCINVHASLLPRWRGVSPVQYAMMHGDSWTGVTIMNMDKGVDTGPVLAQRAIGIGPEDTAGDVLDNLAGQGADLLIHTLRNLANEHIEPIAQTDAGAVYAPKLTKTLSAVRWDREVITVHNQIRALSPWPGTTSFLGEKIIKVTSARPMSFLHSDKAPGTVLSISNDGVQVACGEGSILLTGLQVPGKRPLQVDEFLRGFEIQIGDVFCS